MKIKNDILALIILCTAVTACVKDKLETTYSKQETQIDAYLAKNNTAERTSIVTEIDPETGEEVEKTIEWTDTLRIEYNNGSVRLVQTEGTGEELTEHGAVSFYYAGYVFNSSPSGLFATNHQETAEKAGFVLTDADYTIFEADMRNVELLEGVRNGLIGVRSGEECEILFSGKHAYGNDPFGIIPANSALLFKIWVVGVSND